MKKLSRNQIKYIAIITMIVDHIGFFIPGLPGYICRCIGRIAYPLFLYLFIDGFTKTKHPYQHVFDLLLFGIISEPIRDLCFDNTIFEISTQNVMLTWGIAYLFIIIIKMIMESKKFDKLEKFSTCLILTLTFSGIAFYVNFDYSISTFISALLCYVCLKHNKKILAITSICVVECLCYFSFTPTFACVLAILAIYLYDENIKCAYNKQFKYTFYAFYPIHLLIIFLIRRIYV